MAGKHIALFLPMFVIVEAMGFTTPLLPAICLLSIAPQAFAYCLLLIAPKALPIVYCAAGIKPLQYISS